MPLNFPLIQNLQTLCTQDTFHQSDHGPFDIEITKFWTYRIQSNWKAFYDFQLRNSFFPLAFVNSKEQHIPCNWTDRPKNLSFRLKFVAFYSLAIRTHGYAFDNALFFSKLASRYSSTCLLCQQLVNSPQNVIFHILFSCSALCDKREKIFSHLRLLLQPLFPPSQIPTLLPEPQIQSFDPSKLATGLLGITSKKLYFNCIDYGDFCDLQKNDFIQAAWEIILSWRSKIPLHL